MNNEIIIQQLITKSESIKINLLYLAEKLAKEYINYFSSLKIKKLKYNKLDTFKTTRLDIISHKSFSEEEKEILKFQDKHRFTINRNSYMIINLKGYIIKFIWNNKELIYDHVLTLQELLSNSEIQNSIKINKELINHYHESLYLKSLIYAYAYNILIASAKNDIDYARAGMFKNAYFDIIEYQNRVLDIPYQR